MVLLPKCPHVAQLSIAHFCPLLLEVIIAFEVLDKEQNKSTTFFSLIKQLNYSHAKCSLELAVKKLATEPKVLGESLELYELN